MPYDEPPRYLCASPMTHAGRRRLLHHPGLGGSIFMMKKPDPLAVMECIQRHRISSTLLPPTLIYMVLAHPRVREFDYSSLKYLIYGASPMSTAKLREAMEVFGPVMCAALRSNRGCDVDDVPVGCGPPRGGRQSGEGRSGWRAAAGRPCIP